jgi:hypothetical protein
MKQPEPIQSGTVSEEEFDRNFKPRGAMAFFLLVVLLGIIIWFGIYLIMADRI